MSASRLRPLVTMVFAAVGTSALCAAAALADSDAPPPETTAHTGTLVIAGAAVIAVVLASVVVLRGIARSRRNKQIEEWYAEKSAATPAGAGEPADVPPDSEAGG